MAVKVFILGRPGSGKSSAARRIVKLARHRGCYAVRVNDYDILQEMFQADKEYKQFRPTAFKGFDVLNFSVLDCALKKAEERVRKLMRSVDIIVVEFARDDYSMALKQFNKEFLSDAYFLFIDTDVKTCIQRIHNRVASPTTADDHFVSDNILRCYYSRQYMPPNLIDYGVNEEKVKVISNKGMREDFDKKIYRFISTIFRQESHILVNRSTWQNTKEKVSQAFGEIIKKSQNSIRRDSLQNVVKKINRIRKLVYLSYQIKTQRLPRYLRNDKASAAYRHNQ